MTFISPLGFSLPNEEVECKDEFAGINNSFKLKSGCGWKGIIKDTIKENYCTDKQSWRSLSGREGIKYLCPNCRNVLKNEILRIS